jgi:hypothetical protein
MQVSSKKCATPSSLASFRGVSRLRALTPSLHIPTYTLAHVAVPHEVQQARYNTCTASLSLMLSGTLV